jgi:hypothetical protein
VRTANKLAIELATRLYVRTHPAVFCAVPDPGVAWVPEEPKSPPLVEAPWRLPVLERSLSTLGSI